MKKIIHYIISVTILFGIYSLLILIFPQSYIDAHKILSKKSRLYGFTINNNIIYTVNKDNLFIINIKNKEIQKIKIKNKNMRMERVYIQNGKVYITNDKIETDSDEDIVMFNINPIKLIKIIKHKIKNIIAIDGNRRNEIYAVSNTSDKLLIIDDKTLIVKSIVKMPGSIFSNYDIEYYQRKNKILVSNWNVFPYLIEVDLSTKKTKNHFVGFYQLGIKTYKDLLFITLPFVRRIDIYSLPQLKRIKKIWIDGYLRTIDVINNKYLITGNFITGKIYLVDWKKGKSVKCFNLCSGIREIRFNKANSSIYASSKCGLWEINISRFLK